MKYITLLTLLFTLVSIKLAGQYTVSPIFSMGNKIEMKMDNDGKFYYFHSIKKGQTLYALSKTFGKSVKSLISLNDKTDASVGLDEKIKIEIPQNYLFKGIKPTKNENTVYIPVIYTTKPKDNLYKISKVYFHQSIEEIQKRNNMETTNLPVNTEILLGWYPIVKSAKKKTWTTKPNKSKEQILKELLELKNSVQSQKDTSYKEDTDNEKSFSSLDTSNNFDEFLLDSIPNLEGKSLIVEKDVANWDKNIVDNGELYILHNKAVLDSYVELENEFVNRKVRAKVIGKIPFGSYTSDVKLIISPAAAKALGALDERLRVKIKYYN